MEATFLSNLPVELLQEITEYLDNPSLLNLGLTCKDLHYMALPKFFAVNDIREPAEGWLVAYKTPVETLPAIRAALFVKGIKQLHYYFNPGVERLLDEITDLYHLISRLPRVELVKLHFSVVDGWVSGHGKRTLDRGLWQKRLTALLDMILDKSCTELHITNGSKLKELYTEREPLNIEEPEESLQGPEMQDAQQPLRTIERFEPDKDWKKKGRWSLAGLLRALHPIISRREPAPCPPDSHPQVEPALPASFPPQYKAKRRNKLTDVFIHSDMLLQHTFYTWTLATIHEAFSSLTRLSFRCGELPTSTWAYALKVLYLPNLTNFEISTDLVVCSEGAAFADLESFLSRHPTITSLHLHGVERLSLVPIIKTPILPNLVTVLAHPIWIMSLLRMCKSHPESLSQLSSIGISTEYYQFNSTFDYGLLDDALTCVATFPRSITLTLRFMVQHGVSEWFSKQVDLGCAAGAGSVVASLASVETVIISSAFFVDIKPATVAIIPEWLLLFPCVQHVRFTEQPEDQAKQFKEPMFLKKLASVCPMLKSIEISRNTIDLKDLRCCS